MAKDKDLQFIRIFDFNLIPRALIEQIEGSSYKPEKIYEFAVDIGTDPFTMLYCLADKDHKIRGFFWGTLNPINESLNIHMYSIEKEYQKGKTFSKKFKEFIDKISEKSNITVYFLSSEPEAKIFERIGAKKSKFTLMEYRSEAQVERKEE